MNAPPQLKPNSIPTLTLPCDGFAPRYRFTFFDPTSGRQYVQRKFTDGDTDERKATIFKTNEVLWKNDIGEEVETWVKERWWAWVEEKPFWFTDSLKERIPIDWVPEEGRDDFVGGKAKMKRRSGLRSSSFSDLIKQASASLEAEEAEKEIEMVQDKAMLAIESALTKGLVGTNKAKRGTVRGRDGRRKDKAKERARSRRRTRQLSSRVKKRGEEGSFRGSALDLNEILSESSERERSRGKRGLVRERSVRSRNEGDDEGVDSAYTSDGAYSSAVFDAPDSSEAVSTGRGYTRSGESESDSRLEDESDGGSRSRSRSRSRLGSGEDESESGIREEDESEIDSGM